MKPMNPALIRRAVFLSLLAALLLGCQGSPVDNPALMSAAETPPSRSSAAPEPTNEPGAAQPTIGIWIDPAVPAGLLTPVSDLLAHEQGTFSIAESAVNASVQVVPEANPALAQWIYAAVAPFPTVQDSISFEAIQEIWAGSVADAKVFASEETVLALSTLLGPPDVDSLIYMEKQELLDGAWTEQPTLALVPFDALEPRWKVLEVDGQSPIHTDFDPDLYPLIVHFGLRGEAQWVEQISGQLHWPASNRDPDRMTVLVMSGVSALVRGTAFKMNLYGPGYPGLKIGSWLREADLAHVSHEVAFSATCPAPDPFDASLRFCSDPAHIVLFEEVGVDLVEITGNHLLDWGAEALLYTLDLYDQRGWKVFGGGRDSDQAAQPVLIEHHGNHLAFLGCNAAGPPEDWAGPLTPGAGRCNEDELLDEVNRLRSEGWLPVFTYQWPESKSVLPLPDQVAAFRAAIEAGAVIVSGSQAHRPQAMEFYGEGFIHYGLGNLFFDQMHTLGNRQEFLDRHVFYDGRHISVELLTAMLEDYAQPRPMTLIEREDLLTEIFDASGW